MKWKIKTLERDRWKERYGEREREGGGERLEREARWDLRHQRYRLGLKMGLSAHCRVLLHEPISDLDS